MDGEWGTRDNDLLVWGICMAMAFDGIERAVYSICPITAIKENSKLY
jgi:hypothetical protein